ncbi:MAG: twin-arginine translocase TatA/TatE family subunit [Terriglobales bacterium]
MNFGADLIFFFFLAFLVFGPRKLPEIARVMGKAMAELRRASNEFRFSLEDEIRNADLADEAQKAQATLSSHPAALPEGEAEDAGGEADGAAEWGASEEYRGYGEEDFAAAPELAASEADAEATAAERAHAEADAEQPNPFAPAAQPAAAAGEHAEDDATGLAPAHAPASLPPAPDPGAAPHAGIAETVGGVAGTVPAAERPWPTPERRA